MILFLLSGGLFYHIGCIDEPLQQNTVSIAGVLYSEWGRGSVAFMNITSDGFTIYKTNYGGTFYFDNIKLPYNLTVFTYGAFTSYFNIQNREPMPVTKLGYYFPRDCYVTVNFPPIAQNKCILLKFISDGFHNQDRFDVCGSINYAQFRIEISSLENFINGKLILLEFTGYYGWVQSYEKYGIKDVTLLPGENAITFSENEINYNPEEKNAIIISSSGNAEMYHAYTECYLYFGNSYNELLLERITGSNYNEFTVPVLPGIEYKVKILDVINNQEGEQSSKSILLQPGENSNIFHQNCPKIISPVNNQNNVTDTTTFWISDNSDGVYNYDFWQSIDSTGETFFCDIYTNKKKFALKDLLPKSINIPPNLKFRWNVTKIENYSSVDELISTPFIIDSKYNSLKTSKKYSFTTAP